MADLASKYLVKTSNTYFFEIFKKSDRKCPILVPHTIIVEGGSVRQWYFTSVKTGVVLQKNFNHRSPTEVFNAILKESPLSTLKEKDLDESDAGGYGPVLTVPKIMRRTANLKQNQHIGDLDVNYPPIAMVRAPGDGEAKPFRPHEFHHLISE